MKKILVILTLGFLASCGKNETTTDMGNINSEGGVVFVNDTPMKIGGHTIRYGQKMSWSKVDQVFRNVSSATLYRFEGITIAEDYDDPSTTFSIEELADEARDRLSYGYDDRDARYTSDDDERSYDDYDNYDDDSSYWDDYSNYEDYYGDYGWY